MQQPSLIRSGGVRTRAPVASTHLKQADGKRRKRQLPLVQLALLALGLGIVAGIGAVLFRDLISLVHNLFFTGHFSLHYDANLFTAPECSCISDGGNGRDGRRRYRCGDDRCHDDFRNDARLQHRNANDRRGGHEHRRASSPVSVNHLHLKTSAPWSRDTEGPPRQHVSRPIGPRSNGRGHPGPSR